MNSPILNQPISWENRLHRLQQVKKWQIQGSVIIQTPSQRQSASLFWNQTSYGYVIDLFGPFGLGNIRIQGTEEQVTLKSHQGEWSAKTPEALLQDQLGWHLPISNLYYWIRGLPAPENDSFDETINHIETEVEKRFDTQHRLIYLKQMGWEIHFAYATKPSLTQSAFLSLPTQLSLNTGEKLHAKILIHHFKV